MSFDGFATTASVVTKAIHWFLFEVVGSNELNLGGRFAACESMRLSTCTAA